MIPVQLLVTRENVPPSSWNRSFKAQAWLLHEAHECHRNPRLSHEIMLDGLRPSIIRSSHRSQGRHSSLPGGFKLDNIWRNNTSFPVDSIYSIYTCTPNPPVHFHTWNPSRRADTTLEQCEEGGLQSGLQGLQLRG